MVKPERHGRSTDKRERSRRCAPPPTGTTSPDDEIQVDVKRSVVILNGMVSSGPAGRHDPAAHRAQAPAEVSRRQPAPAGRRVDRQLKVCGGLTVAAGLCLMAAPFVFGYRVVGQAVANDLVTGAALAAVGVAALRRDRRLTTAAIQATLGVWLLLAPTVLRYDGGAFVRVAEPAQAQWTDIWAGGIALALAAWRRWPVPDRS
jgi:hypothetical protein